MTTRQETDARRLLPVRDEQVHGVRIFGCKHAGRQRDPGGNEHRSIAAIKPDQNQPNGVRAGRRERLRLPGRLCGKDREPHQKRGGNQGRTANGAVCVGSGRPRTRCREGRGSETTGESAPTDAAGQRFGAFGERAVRLVPLLDARG